MRGTRQRWGLTKGFTVILKSQWAFVYKQTYCYDYRKLDILLVTDNYIYSGGNYIYSANPSYGIYLFELSTLKLVKCYETYRWLYAFGFRNSFLERDEFYCQVSYHDLNSFYFTQEINENNELTSYEAIDHDLSLRFYNFSDQAFNLK